MKEKCANMPSAEVVEKFPLQECGGCEHFTFEDGVGECHHYSKLLDMVKSMNTELKEG